MPSTKARARAPRRPDTNLKYRKEYVEVARGMSFVGATLKEIATHFGVHVETIGKWRKRYPDFARALAAKKEADDKVVGSLYRRAVGYDTVEKTKEAKLVGFDEDDNPVAPGDSRAVRVESMLTVTKEVHRSEAPNVTAGIFWLKNRQPEKWRDKHEVAVEDAAATVAALNAGRDRLAKLRKSREESDGASD